MFDEPDAHINQRSGWIEVITGSMFSGKTEELMRRIRRARFAKQRVKMYKPLIDTRYGTECVVSHDQNKLSCAQIAHADQMLKELEADGANVIGIDEAQFFGPELVDVCQELADAGKRIIVAGLDLDFMGHPFGVMPILMAKAEHVTKVHAVCAECGNMAMYSHRLKPDTTLLVLGEKDMYEPLCRSCFNRKMSEQVYDKKKEYDKHIGRRGANVSRPSGWHSHNKGDRHCHRQQKTLCSKPFALRCPARRPTQWRPIRCRPLP